MVPMLKGKGDVTDCGLYRAVKLLYHGMLLEYKMKIIERVWRKG